MENTVLKTLKSYMWTITVFMAMLSFFILVLFALFPTVIATHDPIAQDANSILLAPSSIHLMGTDWAGRDIFSRVVHGTRISLYIGIISITLASTIGCITGIFSGYMGGYTDLIVQRIVDTLLGIPSIVMALVIIVSFGSSATAIAVAIAVAMTPQIVRLSRATTLSIKTDLYIDAVESIGATEGRIVFKHFMPNITPVMLSQITGYFGMAIVAETTLSFLGLGVAPPYSSWGRMIQEGSTQYMETAPWTTLFPGFVMSITVVCSAILGDSIGHILNKKHRISKFL
jgi:peptide/nickel transport system permease protein